MCVSVPTAYRVLGGGIALGDDADHLALAQGVVDELDGARAGHGQRQDGLREEQGVPQRKDAQLGGDIAQIQLGHAARVEVGDAVVVLAHVLLSAAPRECAA